MIKLTKVFAIFLQFALMVLAPIQWCIIISPVSYKLRLHFSVARTHRTESHTISEKQTAFGRHFLFVRVSCRFASVCAVRAPLNLCYRNQFYSVVHFLKLCRNDVFARLLSRSYDRTACQPTDSLPDMLPH